MNNKIIPLLFISVLVFTGIVTLFPRNFIDQTIMTLALEVSDDFYTVFYYLTFLGSRTILIPFVILGSIYLYFKTQKIKPSLVFMSGTLLSYLLNELIKLIVTRSRPSLLEEVHAIGYSFPSGHAMISTVCYSLFTYYLLKTITNKKMKILFIGITMLVIFLIGFSRIILNVHYFTDVISGFIFGGLFVIIYLEIINKKTKRSF